MTDLHIEVNTKFMEANTTLHLSNGSSFMFTPPLDEDYWRFRVKLSANQAIVGFPKFNVIGIGFAQEEDWNTNLPSTCTAEKIYEHIKHNKGDEQIADEDCIAAIRLIQEAILAMKEGEA